MGEHLDILEISSDEDRCPDDAGTSLYGPSDDGDDITILDASAWSVSNKLAPSKRHRNEAEIRCDDDTSHNGCEEDCLVLDYDPDGKWQDSEFTNDCSGEVLITGDKGELACRDFPHSRHNCAKFSFYSAPHSDHCGLCHCYVCDTLAPCLYWGDGSSANDHCNATDKEEVWKLLRRAARSGNIPKIPVKLSAAALTKRYRGRCLTQSFNHPVRGSSFRRTRASNQRFINKDHRNMFSQHSATSLSPQSVPNGNKIDVNRGRALLPTASSSYIQQHNGLREHPQFPCPAIPVRHLLIGPERTAQVHGHAASQYVMLMNSFTAGSLGGPTNIVSNVTSHSIPIAPNVNSHSIPVIPSFRRDTSVGNIDVPTSATKPNYGTVSPGACSVTLSNLPVERVKDVRQSDHSLLSTCNVQLGSNTEVWTKMQNVITFLGLDPKDFQNPYQQNPNLNCQSTAVPRYKGDSSAHFQPSTNNPMFQTFTSSSSQILPQGSKDNLAVAYTAEHAQMCTSYPRH